MKDFKLDTNEKITSGFKIPDNYFDDFSEKVMQRLPKEEPKVISFYAKNKRWIYSAAAVLVLALSVPIVYQMQNKEAEMTSSEVENYLVNNTTLSDDDIVNLLEQEDIDKLKEAAPIEKEALEEALSNNPEIEQYITN
jgi:hypothetical protein